MDYKSKTSQLRNRRHNIFENKNLYLSTQNDDIHRSPKPQFKNLNDLRDQIQSYWYQKLNEVSAEVGRCHAVINQLSIKLQQNQILCQKQENKIKELMNNIPKSLIQKIIQQDLNKRLYVITQKFSDIQELYIKNVYQKEANYTKENSAITVDKLKDMMDDRLREILANTKIDKQQIHDKIKNLDEKIKNAQQNEILLKNLLNTIMQNVQTSLKNLAYAKKKITMLENSLQTIQPSKLLAIQYPIKSKLQHEGTTTIKNDNQFQRTIDKYSNIQKRIRETIVNKRMLAPVEVYLDDINFLRKRNGAYLFDCKGDMFKVRGQQLRKLCELRLLHNIKQQ